MNRAENAGEIPLNPAKISGSSWKPNSLRGTALPGYVNKTGFIENKPDFKPKVYKLWQWKTLAECNTNMP